MATDPGAGAAQPVEDRVIKLIERVWRELAALSRLSRLVVGLGLILILIAIGAAFIPDALHVVSYDAKAGQLSFNERWRNIFVGVAGALGFLLSMYVAASQRGRGLPAAPPEQEQANAFVLYSPRNFAEDLELNFLQPGTKGWGQRALYAGADGARSWLAVSLHPEYDIADDKLRPALDQVLAGLGHIGSLISLGPGDGKVDVSLMARLVASKGPGTSYVPIDISEGLLLMTMKGFRKEHAKVRMPFGILGDFEYGWDDFGSLLAQEAQPRLFSILGNTVSNLDGGPEKFFPKLWSTVAEGDYVLFDVLLGDFDDLLGPMPAAPVPYDPNRLFPGTDVMRRYKEFVAQGARRITWDHRVFDDATHRFADSLSVHRRKDPAGFDQLHLLYRNGDDTRTIFKWRRYQPDTTGLQNWLRSALAGCSVVTTSDVADDGKTTRLILLRKEAAGS